MTSPSAMERALDGRLEHHRVRLHDLSDVLAGRRPPRAGETRLTLLAEADYHLDRWLELTGRRLLREASGNPPESRSEPLRAGG